LTRDVHVFDVYEGGQVPADKRSPALRVVMRSPERTLSEKDIAGVRAKILKALERELAAVLRWSGIGQFERHGSRPPAACAPPSSR
jgi:phenylalanyl-tRNA synthetase beta chain